MQEIKGLEDQLDNTKNGPIVKLALLNKVAEEYNEKRINNSIYYQVRSLYGLLQDKYFNMLKDEQLCSSSLLVQKFPLKKTESESITFDNELLKFIYEMLKNDPKNDDNLIESFMNSCNFLEGINDTNEGFNKIIEICKEFPTEWTIVQVCKGPRPQTTFSLYHEIHERDADIYLTLLKHARSEEFPEPICLHFSDISQIKLFKVFSNISAQCKKYMQVKAEDVTTHEAKAEYWNNLKTLDKSIKEAIADFKAYIFPWNFLFRGVPSVNTATGSKTYQKEAFAAVDELCNNSNLELHERVLLSLAVLQAPYLDYLVIEAISEELTTRKKVQLAIQQMLKKFHTDLKTQISSTVDNAKASSAYTLTNYPCILIVDEQLDHFYWEELNVAQEMCRVNSLQCLWRLYDTYKHRIQKGYFTVDVKTGACVIDPDNSLPKTQMRMGAFCKYWLPNWPLKLGEKPTQEELLDYFKTDCYFYAGHGSGLQHVSGKRISQQNIEAVVFLFGCDSTRMNSLGLYSDLIGPHYYYHAALCPSIIGTILPALDAKMDEFSVEIFSRWVASNSKKSLRWDEINATLWIKKGTIEQETEEKIKDKEKAENFYIGSLCGALTRIHARGDEKYYYNTVSYVCRGLPVWNVNVQPLPN